MEVEIVQVDDFEISNVEEVRGRVIEAEKRITNGEFLTEQEYEEEMEKFFKRLDEDS